MTPFKIQFVEESGHDRVAEGVRVGLPFSKGVLRDPGSIGLTTGDGQQVPAHFKPLVDWDDGSVRWLLASFQIDLAANAELSVTVHEDGGDAAQGTAMGVTEGGGVRVDTGVTRVRVGGRARDTFVVQDAQDQELLSSQPKLALVTGDGKSHCADVPDTVNIEDNGPVCAVLFVAGPMRDGSGNAVFRYETRMTLWRGRPDIEVQHTVINVGSEDVVEVDEMSIEMASGHPMPKAMVSTDGEPCAVDLQPDGVVSLDQRCYFWQEIAKDKDGGEADYCVIDSDFGYTIKSNDRKIVEGEHATGWILGIAGTRNVGVAVRDFWEHGPKRLELHGDGRIRIALYPRWEHHPSQPRPVFGPLEKWVPKWGRGGASREAIVKDLQARGYTEPPRRAPLRFGRTRAITHDVLYHFGEPDRDTSTRKLGAYRTPLVPLIDTPYLCASKAMNWFSPVNPKRWPLVEDGLIKGFERYQKEAIEYGLLHFGDIKLAYGNYMTAPGSYANHEYDTVHGLLVQYARGGDRDCFRRAGQAARHIADMDVDQIEGGARMHGYLDSGERHEECYTSHALDHSYVEGLLDHHCMTGDPRSLRAARRVASSCKQIPQWLRERGVAGIDCRTIARACITLLNVYDVTREEAFLAPARETVGMLVEYARDPLAGLKGSVGWRPWLGEGEHMAEHLQELLVRYHSCTGDPAALEALRITLDYQLDKWDPESESYVTRPDRIGHPPERREPPTSQPQPDNAQVLYELPLAYLAKVTGDLSYVFPVAAGLAGYGRDIGKAVGNRAFAGVRLLTMHFIALVADLEVEPSELASKTRRQVMHAPLQKDVPAIGQNGERKPMFKGDGNASFVDSAFGAPVLQTTDASYVSYDAPTDILERPGTLCFWVSQDHDLRSAVSMPPQPRGLVHIAADGHLTNALDVHLTYNEMWVRIYDHRGWLTSCLLVPVAYWRPNDWHHVAVVWNRFTLTAYVDGVRMAQDRAWLVQGGQKVVHVGWRPLNWFAASRFCHLRIFRAPLPGYKIEEIHQVETPYSDADRAELERYRDEGKWTFARGGGTDVSITDVCPVLAADRGLKEEV